MKPQGASARRGFALAAVRLSSLFALLFYGADAITAARPVPRQLGMAWETSEALRSTRSPLGPQRGLRGPR